MSLSEQEVVQRRNHTDCVLDGGSIQPGYSKLLKKPINITSALEAHGAYIYNRLKNPDDASQTQDEILTDLEKEACPGSGACGGTLLKAPSQCNV